MKALEAANPATLSGRGSDDAASAGAVDSAQRGNRRSCARAARRGVGLGVFAAYAFAALAAAAVLLVKRDV